MCARSLYNIHQSLNVRLFDSNGGNISQIRSLDTRDKVWWRYANEHITIAIPSLKERSMAFGNVVTCNSVGLMKVVDCLKIVNSMLN